MKRPLIALIILVLASTVCVDTGKVETGQQTTGSVPLTKDTCYCTGTHPGDPTTVCQIIDLGNGKTAIGCHVGVPTN